MSRLKEVLIGDCLSDAVIYQGVSRDAIQRRMREAILRVLAAGTPHCRAGTYPGGRSPPGYVP